MIPYAIYLLKVTVCSGILFGYYRFVLRNELFHNYNRFYLLAAVALSLVLPLVTIPIWPLAEEGSSKAIQLLQAVNGNDYLDEIVVTARQNNFTLEQWLFLFYCLVSFVFLVTFIYMLLRIRRLFLKHRHNLVDDVYFVNTTARGTPFSFLKCLFWNDHIDPDTPTGNQIFRHELAHIRQKHSYDKLFINVTLIACWCNPFFWLIRRELNMIHEFMADKIAVEDSDTSAFAAMILQSAYPQHQFTLSNPFFYSPIKRRLLMLTKNKDPKTGYIRRIMVLPLALLVFAAFAFKTKNNPGTASAAYNGKKITVVIDAGHGGSDQGALSTSGAIAEKDITLSIIKKIVALNKNPQIEILATRQTDVFQSPQERALFTQQHKADLFVSIHTDGAIPDNAPKLSGMSVWIAKDKYPNAGKSRIFASAVINEFSNNYDLPVAANPRQRQVGIAVLQASPCPSVLIEAGNISNSGDLQFLKEEQSHQGIATKVLAAIEKYAFATESNEPVVALLSAVNDADFPGETTGALTGTPVSGIDTIPAGKTKMDSALIVIDGVISDAQKMKKLNPEDITMVQVLKDKDATDRFGNKGAHGVVMVTTKAKSGGHAAGGTTPDPAKATPPADKTVGIQLRGDASAQPLFVVDGKVQADNFAISKIKGEDVASITVLKDKAAIEKYGSKATNGVVEITMKTKDNTSIDATPANSSAVSIRMNGEPATISPVQATGGEGVSTQQTGGQQVVFTKVENEPEFKGGDSAWRNYLQQHLDATLPVQEGWKAGSYKIVVTFIVHKDGTVSDVKADNYAGTKTAESCVELIKNGPKWQPARQNGHTVDCYRKQPITFVIAKN